MSMRIFSLSLALVLTACGAQKGETVPGETIACALDGVAEFAQVCLVERNGSQVTVRRPDGGFRRFEIMTDGGVNSLEGADPAIATALADGMVELKIGDDRYRLKPEEPAHAAKP